MPRLTKARRDLYAADILTLVKIPLSHIKGQEKGSISLAALRSALEEHFAVRGTGSPF